MKWDHISASHLDKYPKANNKIMGCITDCLPMAYEMYKKGVPVWLVHPLPQISMETNIAKQWPVTELAQAGICMKRWPGAPISYQGPISHEIHLSIYCWKPGEMDMTKVETEKAELIPPTPSSSTQKSITQRGLDQCIQPYLKSQVVGCMAAKTGQGLVMPSLAPAPFVPMKEKVWKWLLPG
ncbi:hypothetical protein P691DRAFT_784821 [Macrolepiota fuliginosa MF-IS2]|uniref:Uncharacterized protein n=1 Tax=Macrolepiota fuliginosa MF-IS2 TaxID=1400762 RepID=A0A9P6BVW7_9AGAR|nr:hypothetical protein P691DRAFT_784821 [Macrolepiota fuliginosa MF-IS2]